MFQAFALLWPNSDHTFYVCVSRDLITRDNLKCLQFSGFFSISLYSCVSRVFYQVCDRNQIRVHIPEKCRPPDWVASGTSSSFVLLRWCPFFVLCRSLWPWMCCAHTHSTRCHVYERTGFRAHVPRMCGPPQSSWGLRGHHRWLKKRMLTRCALCVQFRQHMHLALFVRSDALFLIAGVLRSTLESPEATYGSKTKR